VAVTAAYRFMHIIFNMFREHCKSSNKDATKSYINFICLNWIMDKLSKFIIYRLKVTRWVELSIFVLWCLCRPGEWCFSRGKYCHHRTEQAFLRRPSQNRRKNQDGSGSRRTGLLLLVWNSPLSFKWGFVRWILCEISSVGTRSNSVWPYFGLKTFNLNIFLDIWFRIQIEHQILNKMNTQMAIIIFISTKHRPKYSKNPVWPVRPVGNRFLVWICLKQI
jgi:hypothetical protein